MASQLRRLTASGDVIAGSGYLKSVTLTGGTAASSVVIREGGSAGTIRLTVKAAIDTTVGWKAVDPDGVLLPGAVHATLAGAAAEVAVEIEPAS